MFRHEKHAEGPNQKKTSSRRQDVSRGQKRPKLQRSNNVAFPHPTQTPRHYHDSRPSHLEPPSSARHSVTSSINSSTSRRSILERLTSPFFETNDREFKVYPQRFLNLLLLSLLNFISDWQCYSIAPVGDFGEEKYEGLHSEVRLDEGIWG